MDFFFLKKSYDVKITEIGNKIPSISGLATISASTTVDNKIPNVSSRNYKNYNTKICEIGKKVTDHDHDKYTTTSEFNKLTTKNFAARLVQANLVTKTDLDTKLISLNNKINSNKTKNVLVQNELKQLQVFDSSYFRGKNRFEDDGTQNY